MPTQRGRILKFYRRVQKKSSNPLVKKGFFFPKYFWENLSGGGGDNVKSLPSIKPDIPDIAGI